MDCLWRQTVRLIRQFNVNRYVAALAAAGRLRAAEPAAAAATACSHDRSSLPCTVDDCAAAAAAGPAPFPAAARLKAAELAACLWAAIKLEELQTLVPGCASVAAAAGVPAKCLSEAEFALVAALHWKLMDGWVASPLRSGTAMC